MTPRYPRPAKCWPGTAGGQCGPPNVETIEDQENDDEFENRLPRDPQLQPIDAR